MKQLSRNFILGFLLLWLPLQGFAAASMSYCRHEHSPPPALHAGMHEQHGQHGGHDCGHDQNSSASSSSHILCDDCGFCHLGAAPALLSTPVALSNEAGFSFKFSFDTRFSLFFPEQPQRPPHALFS
jgi:hypothetical protein